MQSWGEAKSNKSRKEAKEIIRLYLEPLHSRRQRAKFTTHAVISASEPAANPSSRQSISQHTSRVWRSSWNQDVLQPARCCFRGLTAEILVSQRDTRDAPLCGLILPQRSREAGLTTQEAAGVSGQRAHQDGLKCFLSQSFFGPIIHDDFWPRINRVSLFSGSVAVREAEDLETELHTTFCLNCTIADCLNHWNLKQTQYSGFFIHASALDVGEKIYRHFKTRLLENI